MEFRRAFASPWTDRNDLACNVNGNGYISADYFGVMWDSGGRNTLRTFMVAVKRTMCMMMVSFTLVWMCIRVPTGDIRYTKRNINLALRSSTMTNIRVVCTRVVASTPATVWIEVPAGNKNFALRGPITSTVRTVCTGMAASTTAATM